MIDTERLIQRINDIFEEARRKALRAIEEWQPAPASETEKMLDAAEVAARTGLKKSKVYALHRSGQLPAIAFGEKTYRWPESRVDEFLRSH